MKTVYKHYKNDKMLPLMVINDLILCSLYAVLGENTPKPMKMRFLDFFHRICSSCHLFSHFLSDCDQKSTYKLNSEQISISTKIFF